MNRPTPERGILFVMTGASGVGKGSIRAAAHDTLADVVYSVSATTRLRRPTEVDGIDYHFRSRAEFEALIAAGGLLEYAEYVGDYYGTPAAPLDAALAEGRDVLLEIELAGARQVKARRPEAVMIFIVPPSMAELERRLRGRGTDDDAKIARRLARAREEIGAVREFDYAIVNDDLARATDLFRAVLLAERARSARVTDAMLAAFLASERDASGRLW
jgi:guanylate kinase